MYNNTHSLSLPLSLSPHLVLNLRVSQRLSKALQGQIYHCRVLALMSLGICFSCSEFSWTLRQEILLEEFSSAFLVMLL